MILPYKRLQSYENITVYDFRQLYPNTAIQHNLAPDVICCECCKYDDSAKIVTNDKSINAKNYWTCRLRKGSYPQAVEKLTELRARYEELRDIAQGEGNTEKAIEYGLKQQAVKLFSNSGYGVFANAHFEYGDVRTAELITACGRTKLGALREIAKEQFGFDVVYGDTDSVFVLNSTPEKQKAFEEFCKSKLGVPARYEKTFNRLLLISAKNYMGEYVDKKGKKEFMVKGLVGKKSNTPNWARQIFEQVKECWKNEEKDRMLEVVHEGVLKLDNGAVSKDDLLVRVKLGQEPATGYNKKKGQEKSPAKILGMRFKKHKDESVEFLLADGKATSEDGAFTLDIDEISIKKYRARLEIAVLKILVAAGFDTESIYDAIGLKVPSDGVLRAKLYGKAKGVDESAADEVFLSEGEGGGEENAAV